LTDRLPKPDYSSEEKLRREKEEKFRRRTYEAPTSLPDINKLQERDSQLKVKK
jgi:hypothetical protein